MLTDYHSWQADKDPHGLQVETADFDKEVEAFMKEDQLEDVPPSGDQS